MADNLRWLTVNAFPGVDYATADHLIQPPRLGPAAMRRLLAVDPFTERGQFNPAPGYAHLDATALMATQGVAGYLHDDSLTIYTASSGRLYRLVAGEWVQLESSHLPMSTVNRIRFANAFNALFMVDGATRPKVLGWNYVMGDTQVEWDTERVLAEIKYTRGQKTEGDSTDDDFYAEGLCFHQDRLVLWKGTEARMSAPAGTGGPTCFYSEETDLVQQGWWMVDEGDGLDITWGGSYENQMLVMGKPFSLHGYVGNDPASQWSRLKLDEGRGIYAPDSPAFGSQRLWFCSYEGPCYLDIEDGVRFVGDAITTLWEELSDAQRQSVIGWWQDQRYNIVLPIAYTDPPQSDIPAEAKILLSYDPVTKRWAESYGVHGVPALLRPANGAQNQVVANSAGLWENISGTTLNGVQAVQELITPWITFGEPWRDKWIRRLEFELVQSAETIEVSYATDFQPTWRTAMLPGKRPSTVWGSFMWRSHNHPDVSYWTAGGKYTISMNDTVHCKTFRLRIRGRGLKLRAIGLGFMYEGT